MDEKTLAKLKERGVQTKVAKHFGISAQAVSLWIQSQRIPPERVLGVEKVTGISRTKLSPALYPSEAA